MPDIISVSALNRYVKSILDADSNIQSVYIKGQISNFKNHYQTGHFYFSLKDEKAQVRAVMFRSANQKLKFTPENDMSVIVRARVSIYEVSGDYQIYVDDMQPDGVGALALAFEQLRKKLAAEGLFDAEHKKKIPAFPKKVGVVTSESGAAVRDIINVISRRYPVCEIILYPVAVQGSTAAEQIARAIAYLNREDAADVLIVGRGGGSIEDLWAFNEEATARAVYESRIPVISAVGHETDFTICDYVADLRAPTPSAAAELAVPDIRELRNIFYTYGQRLSKGIETRLEENAQRLNNLRIRLASQSPASYIENLMLRLDRVSGSMQSAYEKEINSKKAGLEILAERLSQSDPLKILSKGYGIVTKGADVITDCSELESGDIIKLRLYNGEKECEVL